MVDVHVVTFFMGIHRHATLQHSWLARVPVDPYGRLATPVRYKPDSQVDQYMVRMLPDEEQQRFQRRDAYDTQACNSRKVDNEFD